MSTMLALGFAMTGVLLVRHALADEQSTSFRGDCGAELVMTWLAGVACMVAAVCVAAFF
jgi:hypothetical protein